MEHSDDELITYLSQFLTPRRIARMEEVLGVRTRYITVLLEDIYQPHNASAVLRSCDSCGVQDVHIVEKRNRYRVNPGVELGTAQWLTLHTYRDAEDPTLAAVDTLRRQGYRIVATTPHTDDVSLPQFDIARGKVALCFGREMEGLSETLLAQADEFLKIPMYGFVESFNISVSAAITLYTLTQELRRTDRDGWALTPQEQQQVRLGWLRRSLKESDQLERRFREERGSAAGG